MRTRWARCARLSSFVSRLIGGAAAALLLVVSSGAGADILVVAPHPDDDILTSAGVIVRALERGEEVHVVYMTNGDVDGTTMGHARQAEAVRAQAELGLAEQHLIFLGYPDANMSDLYFQYPSPTDVLSHDGRTTTYGSRGLGQADYHTYRFGVPATYNGFNVTHDLADVLSTFRPEHVFVTSEWDGHADHRATYFFVRDALDVVRNVDPNYDPTIHKTIVWAAGEWPNTGSATTYFAQPPNLAETALDWNERESLDVPLSLQRTDLLLNPKWLAIERHATQGGNGSYLSRYLHKDEFFWPERASGENPPVPNAGFDQEAPRGATVSLNATASFDLDGPLTGYQWRQIAGHPVVLWNPDSAMPTFVVPDDLTQREAATFELVVYDGFTASFPDAVTVVLGNDIQPPQNVARLAIATASSENSSTQQTAAKAIDGFAEGAPGDYTREWATTGGGAGSWIELTWSSPQIVDNVVLADRPNMSDWIVSGTISFSDGSTLSVAALNNNGTPTSLKFSPRRVTSVRFDITAVAPGTINVGLAEFQVFSPSVMPGNLAPVAVVGADQFVGLDAIVTLNGWESYDPDEDPLTYEWIQIGGPPVVLTDASTATPTFRTPSNLADTTVYLFQLVVRDGTVAGTPAIAVVVAEPPRPANIARNASVVASSQNAGTMQLATKAIDGVADGAPGDFTREWATLGQGVGAWIELSWAEPQSIDRVVLHDRPNDGDQIRGGVLTFSDGTSLIVGALDDRGGATTIAFAPKLATSLRFTVTAVRDGTLNVGLAELEVWSVVGAIDYGPVLRVGSDQTVTPGAWVQLDGSDSYDPAGQPITYQWTQTAGPSVLLSDPGSATPSFVAPTTVSGETTLLFELQVADGSNIAGPAITRVTVQPPPPPPNLGRQATATASSAASQQSASKVNDGSTLGYPVDGTREWSSAGEGAGAWVQLSWTTLQVSNRIVLHDRPNLDDHVLAGTLTFSDGHTIQVGALDNAGGPTEITFQPRYFLWVRFTVTAVAGSTANIGLAEFQVLDLEDIGGNFPPVAATGEPQTAREGDLVTLQGDASYDLEGAPLTFAWTQVLGPAVALSSDSVANPTFVVPAGSVHEEFAFELVVSDGLAFSDPATTSVTIVPTEIATNLALTASASASSQNAGTGQLAASAIDGVIQGYSNGSHVHEWATLSEGAGAWLQLDWATPQTASAVVLYDRPNLDDRVMAGRLDFSDGTSVLVGALHNDGNGVTVAFSSRQVTWIRFTVTQTAPGTSNVGLSEVQVLP